MRGILLALKQSVHALYLFQMGYIHNSKHRAGKSGFTIVELLIVVVVIAILAAITIVAYNGISQKAHQSTLAADAHSAATIMGTDQAMGGSYPTSAAASNGGKGLPASPGTSYLFHSDGTTYCISVNSSFSGVTSYYISSSNPTPSFGQCPQDLASTVTTIAGNGTVGNVDGATGTSTIAAPAALVADGSGTLYFSDSSTSRIRKLTTAGQVTTLAGNGSSSCTEGTGTGATFNWPQAFTLDGSGTLTIADTHCQKVRKLSASKVSSTFAGSTQGVAGTIGTSAGSLQLNDPRGIVYDPTTSTLLISDSQNHRILRLDSAGTITKIYGQVSMGGYVNGTETAAKFLYPEGLAVDATGNIFVADTNNNRIRKIATNGDVSLVAGTGAAGTADGNALSTAQFNKPGALTVANDGTIYVSDTANNLIRKITPDGTVSTIAGSGTAGFADGTGTDAKFNDPTGIAIGNDGRLYVCDRLNNRIRVLNI